MKVVTIGGGTGTYNIIKAIKDIPNIQISTIVTTSDDGGSAGKLRDEYGILPSGDIRRAIVALSDEDKHTILRNIFNYRFKGGLLDGHNLGNLITLALEDITGSYGKALDRLEELFDLKGKVYPVTFEKTRLLAELENSEFILGETNIDIPKHDGNLKIKNLYVIKENYGKILKQLLDLLHSENKSIVEGLIETFINDIPNENPKLQSVIENSDYIIVTPGDFYTSILPNFLIGNVKQHLLKSKAKKILFINLFTKFGETTDFKLSDFINELKKYLEIDMFDYIIAHDWEKYPITNDILTSYLQEKKNPIMIDINDSRIIKSDLIKQIDMARHDWDKIKLVLDKILL